MAEMAEMKENRIAKSQNIFGGNRTETVSVCPLSLNDLIFICQNAIRISSADCNIGDSDLTYDVMLACMSPIEAQKHRTKLLESPGQNALQAGGATESLDVKKSRADALQLVDRGGEEDEF